jgi:hypothetical protein
MSSQAFGCHPIILSQPSHLGQHSSPIGPIAVRRNTGCVEHRSNHPSIQIIKVQPQVKRLPQRGWYVSLRDLVPSVVLPKCCPVRAGDAGSGPASMQRLALQRPPESHILRRPKAVSLSVRWVRKLLLRWRVQGDGALRRGLQGRPSNRKAPSQRGMRPPQAGNLYLMLRDIKDDD